MNTSPDPEFTQLPISADARPLTRGEVLTLWILGLAFAGVLLAGLAQTYVPQKLSVLFFIVLWPLMLVVHELGHALMAAALGWHVGRISIGFGPVVWEGHIGKTRVTWRVVPIEGFVLPAPATARFAGAKSALIYAAGPGAELLVLGVLVYAVGLDRLLGPGTDVVTVATKTLAIVIVWGAGFNLLPFATGGGVSDGLGILLSPFMNRASIEERLLVLDRLDVEELAQSGRTRDAIAKLDDLIQRGARVASLKKQAISILAAAGQSHDARARLDQLLDGRPIVEVEDISLLHLDALVALADPTPDALAVDLGLNRALRMAPDNLSLRVTRGIADIRRGRTVAGANALADVYRELKEPMDAIRVLGWLSVAARRIGHDDATTRFERAFAHVNHHAPLAEQIARARGGDYQ